MSRSTPTETQHALVRDALVHLINVLDEADILSPDDFACAAQQGRHILTITGTPSEAELEVRLQAELAGLAVIYAQYLQYAYFGVSPTPDLPPPTPENVRTMVERSEWLLCASARARRN